MLISRYLFTGADILRNYFCNNWYCPCAIYISLPLLIKFYVLLKNKESSNWYLKFVNWWNVYHSLSGCIGIICPCFLFGKNAETLGSGTLMGSCMTHFILWALVNTVCCLLTEGILLGLPGCFIACYACGYRRELRLRYNLQVCDFPSSAK